MKKCAVFTLMMTSFSIGCSSDRLLGVAYWMGSLGDPKDDFKFHCQIKLIKKDDQDNLFIQYYHENNQKNSSAFWVKSLDPNSGQHYAECLRFDVETNFDFFEEKADRLDPLALHFHFDLAHDHLLPLLHFEPLLLEEW